MFEEPNLELLLRERTASAGSALVKELGGGCLRCLACGHRCSIPPGRTGVCKIRHNDGGTLLVPYGYVAALQCDPIEKKPFYHAMPGTDALSFGMLGCNLHCSFCQNWITSQTLRDPEAVAAIRDISVHEIVEMARRHNASTVASTYNEPLITSEWAAEVFQRAKSLGLKCAYVSNGNATSQVLDFLRPWLDMYKVDLKCYDDQNYRRLGCTLANVLDSIIMIKERGLWLEIVTLVVPGFNDSSQELRRIAKFVASVSLEIPWHVTAFHSTYKMAGRGRTQAESLIAAAEIGREEGLSYVYAGNIPGHAGLYENTWCPQCGELLIERAGFHVAANRISSKGTCPKCAKAIAGLWE